MINALEELKEFEKRADIEIAKLSIWKLPIRSILSSIYVSADGQYVGKRFSRRSPKNDEVGTEMLMRMSYISRFFKECPREVGSDIDDALSVVNDQFVADIVQLLAYCHLCEIMPLVHRGHFTVERHPKGFALRHPNERFRVHEESDTLMSEMSLPHDLMAPPYPIESCIRMTKAWPDIPGEDLVRVLKKAYDHYLEYIFESPLLSDESFQVSFGFSRADFIRIRAALMAYADFCLGMADAAEVLSGRAFTRPKREHLQREVREWVAPLLSRNHIVGIAAGLSTVEPSMAEKIIDLFTINPDTVDASGVGEGFFPPFLRLQDSLLFSPHALKRTMPERNLLYKMVRTEKPTFDNVVSCHLEPALVERAAQLLSELHGIEVRTNVNWEKGEIDLLAYHEDSNSALQLQAKAGVPPQGARMVAQVESRTLEAASQLERFLGLTGAEKDEICSSAIGRKVSDVSWISGVLVRTCLGTEKAWSGIREFVPLNPLLLQVALKRVSEGGEFTFLKLGKIADKELGRFRSSAILGWENKTLALLGEEIQLPLLRLNSPEIWRYRRGQVN